MDKATETQTQTFAPIEGDAPDSLAVSNDSLVSMGALTVEEARKVESRTQVKQGQTLLGKLTLAQRSMMLAKNTLAKAELSGDERAIRAARTVFALHKATAMALQRRVYGNIYSTGRNRKRRR